MKVDVKTIRLKFDFLGYSFRPRMVSKRARGMGVSFSPAASTNALTAIRRTIRRPLRSATAPSRLEPAASKFGSKITNYWPV